MEYFDKVDKDFIFKFGKYKNRNIKDIIEKNKAYICWCFSQDNILNDIDDNELWEIITPVINKNTNLHDKYIEKCKESRFQQEWANKREYNKNIRGY